MADLVLALFAVGMMLYVVGMAAFTRWLTHKGYLR